MSFFASRIVAQIIVSSQRICKEPYYRMSLGVSPRNLVVSSDPALNFATASEDDEIYSKKKVSRQDPMSHRIIEKRRRDRMNNCLADLSRLIPQEYLKKGRGRIEKTEIIEMSIRYMKYLTGVINDLKRQTGISAVASHHNDDSVDSSPPRSPPVVPAVISGNLAQEQYRHGYQDCLQEVVHYLDEEAHMPRETVFSQLVQHLQQHYDKTLSMRDIHGYHQAAEPTLLHSFSGIASQFGQSRLQDTVQMSNYLNNANNNNNSSSINNNNSNAANNNNSQPQNLSQNGSSNNNNNSSIHQNHNSSDRCSSSGVSSYDSSEPLTIVARPGGAFQPPHSDDSNHSSGSTSGVSHHHHHHHHNMSPPPAHHNYNGSVNHNNNNNNNNHHECPRAAAAAAASSYKLKNSIMQRFTADQSSVIKTSPSPPPTPQFATCNQSSNGIVEPESKHHPHQHHQHKQQPPLLVPAFALHNAGYYVPLTLDTDCVREKMALQEIDTAPVFHPVNIPVRFPANAAPLAAVAAVSPPSSVPAAAVWRADTSSPMVH
ncbi:transcription factor cwo-like isoform X2 [Trichogramma pretiosum]|uniref:transcription factor cwo-like isoform X2 n=1 Tax=Trichogramma pretiosum TaxID=7493 RepID=UPI0006C96796|nr:transcription factor cwo-like isoform X2 [Trichogramma pretiosum]